MKQRLGIIFTLIAMVLTWPLHIGAASFVLAESIGEFIAPGKDYVLLWLPICGAGIGFLVFLIVGLLARRRRDLYLSAFVFLSGLWIVARSFPHPSADWTIHIYDWILCIGLGVLLILSASYLIWLARHTTSIPNQ
jgi:hypothetical protein